MTVWTNFNFHRFIDFVCKTNQFNQFNTSNQFKPNFNVNKVFFGQLHLGEYLSFDPFKSQILKEKQPKELIELCEFNLNERFKLLYRASEHGFGSKDFHYKCDGQANTLTILKANGFTFGGFTSAAWDSSAQRRSDRFLL